MIYGIFGLLLFCGLAYYLTSCKNKSNEKENIGVETQDSTQLKKNDSKNNPYSDLRNMALNATLEQIGVQLPENQTKIYGVIMDWDVGEGIATLVAFKSGDASLYLSNGGGMIGGSGHENIRKAAVEFIDKAENYLDKVTKTEVTPLPDKNSIKFYFLTNKGKLVGKESLKNIENNSSEWLDLFNEGNELITEIRLITEKSTN